MFIFLSIATMSSEEQFVTICITAYETEPVKIISVPAHYSLGEICEVIWSEMGENTTTLTQDALTLEPPNRNLSQSLLLPVSYSDITYSTRYNCRKAWGQARQTLPLGKLHRKTAQSMRSYIRCKSKFGWLVELSQLCKRQAQKR